MTVVVCALFALAVWLWPHRAGWERPLLQSRVAESDMLEVAQSLDLLALTLAGGAPTFAAIEHVAQASSDDVRAQLGKVSAALKWGVAPETAWSAAPARWRGAQRAFLLAERAGAAPSPMLRQAARDIRAAETERVALAGAKAGVRIVLPLGLCFLPAFILLTIVPLVLGLMPST